MTRRIDWLKRTQTKGTGQKSRRTKKVMQPASSTRRYSVESQSQPPVMVRGSMAGIPLRARKASKSQPRRRYDLTLNVPGAEMRLPSLPMVHIGPRVLSGAMVVALALLLYFIWNSPTFLVGAPEIQGLQRLSSNDVNMVMDIVGQPVFLLNSRDLEERLSQAFPEFSSVSVDIGFPNDVYIDIEERQPILTWKQDGRTMLVDANGVAFPQRDMLVDDPTLEIDASSPPPIVANADELSLQDGVPIGEQFLPVEMVSAIISMSALAPEGTPLIYDSEHGLGWKDSQGWDVYLGDIRDIDMKLRVYQSLVKLLTKEKVNPVLISVEYVHTPYYRLAQ